MKKERIRSNFVHELFCVLLLLHLHFVELLNSFLVSLKILSIKALCFV